MFVDHHIDFINVSNDWGMTFKLDERRTLKVEEKTDRLLFNVRKLDIPTAI